MSGRIVPIGIVPIKGRYFECDFGKFFLDPKRGYVMDKLRVFFYHVQIPVPLDIEAIFRVNKYIRERGIDKFTQQALRDMIGTQVNHTHEEVSEAINITQKMISNSMGKEEIPEHAKKALDVSSKLLSEHAMQLSSTLLDSKQRQKAEEAIGLHLGQTTYGFLRSLMEIDQSAIDHMATEATQTERPPRKSKEIPYIFPRADPGHIGLLVIDNKRILKKVFKVVKDPRTAKWYGYVKGGGRVDITNKEAMYKAGKTSVYIVRISTLPDVPPEQGNGKKRRIMDQPEDAEAVNLHCYDVLQDFILYDPLVIQNSIVKTLHTQQHLNREYRPVKKQGISPMMILMIMIGGVAIYQGILNPMISDYQTKLEVQSENARIAAAHNANATHTTTPTPNPPVSNGGSQGILPWKIPGFGFLIPTTIEYNAPQIVIKIRS